MKKKHYVILPIVLLVVVGGFLGVKAMLARTESNLESLKYMEIAQIDLSIIEDGVYTGSYSAFPVAAEVSVTVKDHVITAIELVKHENGQGAPAEVIPGRVVESQSLQVDSVSGATYSSRVILKAIENALLSAAE
jgi:uncharacterized protein with FMN-binding domain